MDDQILDILSRKIEEQIASHSQALVQGVSKDYAEYRELCGVIRGLQTAQRETADLVRKLKDNDDD
jgi:hypothetical protein